jgi:hypothetical protein
MRSLASELIDGGEILRKDGPMVEYEFSEHAYVMLRERNIQQAWVKLAIENPERKELKDDGTVHYIRSIEQYGWRYLRVVVNPDVRPQRIVTVFFDRRIERLR